MKSNYQITESAIINAETSKVFSVLEDVGNWHLWTKSITKISFIDHCKFETNGKVRIEQPKLTPAIWTITEINKNHSFTWRTKTFGVTITAKHLIKNVNNKTLAELHMSYEGFFASLLYKLTVRLTKQYLNMEISGLKKECEK